MGVKLGQMVRDKISGFEGVVTGHTRYLNGCVRVEVSGIALSQGRPVSDWVDETQLELLADGVAGVASVETGGPRSGPPSIDPA